MTDLFDLGLTERAPKASLVRRLVQVPTAVVLSLLVVFGIVTGGVVGMGKVFKPKPSNDFGGAGVGAVQIEVHPGDTTTDIGRTLVKAGVVKSVSAFVDAGTADAKSRAIQPGTYQLHSQMSATLALALLESAGALVGGRVTIPEGARLAKTEQLIAANGKIKIGDLQAALGRSGQLGLPPYANAKAEGFLYPATYTIDSATTPTSLLVQMVTRFKQVAASVGLVPGAAALNLTPYQVVTVASLIEAEVKRPEDYPQVAEVIINRLHRGMRLSLDSTVNYALGTSKPSLSQSDLKVDSLYNTYLHAGLPPTPIDSPGLAALNAALHPAQGKLLYFVTVDQVSGETVFAASSNEIATLVAQAKAAAAAASAAAVPSKTP
jgi:UPF0755 protein